MKKKTIENPIIKDTKKIKKIKSEGLNDIEEGKEIRNFIIIVIIIVVIAGIVYITTELINKNKTAEYEKTVTEGKINYDLITVGTLLNRPYDNYYVLVYNAEDDNAVKYSTMLTKYMNKKNDEETKDKYVKIYFCNLGNTLNSSYYNVGEDNKSNPKAKEITELDFGDLTLLEIKNGKIVKYLEDYTTIHDFLEES